MDTNPVELTDNSWVKVANAGDTFFIVRSSGPTIYLAATIADSAPTITSGYIPLTHNGVTGITSTGVPGAYIWARILNTHETGVLSVTK